MTDFSKVEDILEQAGVKGMRWGFRKRSDGSGYVKVGRTRGSEDYQKSRDILQLRMRDMSNKELQEVNSRLQLEAKFRQLNPSVVARGQRLVTQALGVGTTINDVDKFLDTPAGGRVYRAVRGQDRVPRVPNK